MFMRKSLLFWAALGLSFFLPASSIPLVKAEGTETMVARGLNEGLKKKIFLDLRDINAVDVLKFLALEGDINIVTSRNVQGRSTLLLRDVSIGDALEIIVVSNNLAYDIKGEIIYVMTEDEYFEIYGKKYNDKRDIKTRTLKYVKPSYALTALQSIQSAIGKVIIDEETGKVIMIDTDEKIVEMNHLLDRIERKMDTSVIKLQYAKAEDVAAQLRSRLDGKSVGNIMADNRSNQVFVTAYPERLEKAVEMIKAMDRNVKAVSIETRILQLTLNPTYDYGIDWQKTFQKADNQNIRNLKFRSAFPIASTVSSSSALGSVGQLTFGEVDENEITLELKAMKEVQNTKVLANPRLMILNRQEARINIGDKIPYVVTTTTGTGNNVSISEEIKFIDVGLLLVVRPVINDDGYITMSIRPEISSQTGTLTTPAGATIPQVNTTFLETSVVVKDGITIILGGLRRDDFTEDSKGVPYLMDVPVLGNLFKSRDESYKKTEIVIFLTPTIVDPDQEFTGQPLDIRRDGKGKSRRGGKAGQTLPGRMATSSMDPFPGKPLDLERTRLASRSAA